MVRKVFGISVLFLVHCSFAQHSSLDEPRKFITEGKFEIALNRLKSLEVLNKSNHEFHFLIGKTFLLLNNYDDAISYLENATRLCMDSTSYYNTLASAYAKRIENSGIFTKVTTAKKVRNCWENVIRIDKNEIELRIRLVKFYLLAPGLFGGSEERGFIIVKELKVLDDFSASQLMLEYYIEENEFEFAQKEFNHIHANYYQKNIWRSRNNPIKSDFFRYGYYLVKRKKYDDAVTVFKDLTIITPDDPNAFDSLGEALKLNGNIEEAKSAFKQALLIDSTFAPSIQQLQEFKK